MISSAENPTIFPRPENEIPAAPRAITISSPVPSVSQLRRVVKDLSRDEIMMYLWAAKFGARAGKDIVRAFRMECRRGWIQWLLKNSWIPATRNHGLNI
jgi:hypothetical protein